MRDALMLARISAFAAIVPLLLRLPLPRLSALVSRPLKQRATPQTEIERLNRLVALAPRVAHPLVRPGCLTRGMTLYWFLRRAGLDVELRFGLDPGDGRAAGGHCWIALDGMPYLEKIDPRPLFPEIYRLPLGAQ